VKERKSRRCWIKTLGMLPSNVTSRLRANIIVSLLVSLLQPSSMPQKQTKRMCSRIAMKPIYTSRNGGIGSVLHLIAVSVRSYHKRRRLEVDLSVLPYDLIHTDNFVSTPSTVLI